MPSQTEEYQEEYRNLLSQASEWSEEWMDIRDYILPRTGMFADLDEKPQQYEDHSDKIYDGTASRAMRVLAAGMQGGLTSPARPWFRLGLHDENLMKAQPIQAWLKEVEKRMYSRFARSNFYNSIHNVYTEEAGYGTAAMIIEEDPVNITRFVTLTAGSYVVSEDARGLVDTLYRRVWMQAHQMQSKFGFGKLPTEAKKDMQRENNGSPFNWHQLLHCIKPRLGYDPTKIDSVNMPFESTYMEWGGNEDMIMKSGYKGKPLVCPRWDTNSNAPYGRSPGHDVLPDVRMLQAMALDKMSGLEKVVDPPLKASGGMKTEAAHMAGSTTYADPAMLASFEPIYQVQFDLRGLVLEIQDLRLQIREGLYNDLFLMLAEPTPNMTATEVAERHSEKLLMLGPVIERQFYELLNPIIDRVFEIMWDAGLLPPPPPELIEAINRDPANASIKVHFVSLLAQAQKLVTTQSIDAVSGYVLNMAQAAPQIIDKLNFDKAVDEYVEATGAPPEIVYTDDVVRSIRKQKQAAMEAEVKRQQAMQGADTAKTMSETDTEGDNALTALEKNTEVV